MQSNGVALRSPSEIVPCGALHSVGLCYGVSLPRLPCVVSVVNAVHAVIGRTHRICLADRIVESVVLDCQRAGVLIEPRTVISDPGSVKDGASVARCPVVPRDGQAASIVGGS